MRAYVAGAALAGWAGLTIQLYLIGYSRWMADASLLAAW